MNNNAKIISTILDDFQNNEEPSKVFLLPTLPKIVAHTINTNKNNEKEDGYCAHNHLDLPDILANISTIENKSKLVDMQEENNSKGLSDDNQCSNTVHNRLDTEGIGDLNVLNSNTVMNNNHLSKHTPDHSSSISSQNGAEYLYDSFNSNSILQHHLNPLHKNEVKENNLYNSQNALQNNFCDNSYNVGHSEIYKSLKQEESPIPTSLIHYTPENSYHNGENKHTPPGMPHVDSKGLNSPKFNSNPLIPHRISSMLGYEKPFWIPDDQAIGCMYCDQKFTLVRRRHHCRACGKILCSTCCNKRLILPSMDFRLSRVCTACYQLLNNDLGGSSMTSSLTEEDYHETENGNSNDKALSTNDAPENLQHNISPNPLRPEEYCSTVPPHVQAHSSATKQPPVVYVPINGVLKNSSSIASNSRTIPRNDSPLNQSQSGGKKKQVMFSDGIRPGGDLSLLDDLMATSCTLSTPKNSHYSPYKPRTSSSGRNRARRINSDNKYGGATFGDDNLGHDASSSTAYYIVSALNYLPTPILSFGHLRDPTSDNLNENKRLPTLRVSEHLKIMSTLISLQEESTEESQLPKKYLCLTTVGLKNVGQDEIVSVFLIPDQYLNEFMDIENDFNHLQHLVLEFGYQMHQLFLDAIKGNRVSSFGFLPLTHISDQDYDMIINKNLTSTDLSLNGKAPSDTQFFRLYNNKLHGGFILFPPCPYHSITQLVVPPNNEPFQFALLVHRWETPWAKMLPLRLLLRMGIEYKVYPYPFVSILDRKSTFYEINHTIINLLADSRNFKYTLPRISGFYISINNRTVTLNVCRENLKEVLNIISQSTVSDHVLAFAGNLNVMADAHLVCVQDESTNQYITERFGLKGSGNKVSGDTGAAFIVFNGSMKDEVIFQPKSLGDPASRNQNNKTFNQPPRQDSNIRISLVEDGIIVHVTPNDLIKISSALKGMNDLVLGSSDNQVTPKYTTPSQELCCNRIKDIIVPSTNINEDSYFPDDEEWTFDEDEYDNGISQIKDDNLEREISQTLPPPPILTTLGVDNKDPKKELDKDKLVIHWIDGDKISKLASQIKGCKSLIDGMNLGKITSFRPSNFIDYVKGDFLIRLVEIYYIKMDAIFMAKSDTLDVDRLAENLSKAFCSCIVHRLKLLVSIHILSINLRISVDTNKVGYELSYLGKEYQPFLAEIDDYLIPIIHSALNYTSEGGSLIIELLFNILPSLSTPPN